MVKKKNKTKSQIYSKNVQRVNIFGGLLYFNVVIQWFMAVALLIPVMIGFSDVFKEFTKGSEVIVIEPSAPAGDPGLFFYIGAFVIVFIILGLTIYVLATMPKAVAKTGRDVVRKSSATALDVVIKTTKKKDTKKLRERLTPKIVFYVKLSLVSLPVLLVYVIGVFIASDLEPLLSLFIAACLALWSLFLVAVQYLYARSLRVKAIDIW